ncbi:MAG: TRIC cation channel family protein [Candidatus Eremiobacteraeota bacterium]|nr:TRIC cation channel family protein [Candidatus Eremiobacteraeota bacterium]
MIAPSKAKAALLLTLDVTGTFVFAVGGALAGVAGRLDLLGVTVLAFATAVGGGVIRDVLLGATPPAALRDWRYSTIALLGAAVGAMYAQAFGHALPPHVAVIEAAGLSLVAIAGAEKALDYNMPPLVAVVLGGVSGVGGGTIRDILLARVPVVLHSDFYASAALAGAAVMVICRASRVSPPLAAAIGGMTCFALRLSALALHWGLPVIAKP